MVKKEKKDSKKIKRLIKALRNDNSETRKGAFFELARMGELAVEPLIEDLKKSKTSLTKEVPHLLAKIGEPAIEPLIRTLKDTSLNLDTTVIMHTSAVIALASMSDGASESLIELLKEKAVEPLIDRLNKDYCIGYGLMITNICNALGNIGDSRAIEPLKRTNKAWKDDELEKMLIWTTIKRLESHRKI